MKRAVVLSLALTALLAAVPARAGKVYVPVLDRAGASGSQHKTEVWIANNGAEERRYGLIFLAAGTNGTQRPAEGPRAGVLGGRTNRLVGLTTAGAFGMVELDAAPQLLIDARLVNLPAAGAGASTPVPVISSDNALAGASTAHLVGLARTSSGLTTDFDLVNLAETAMECSVSFNRADGSQLGSTAVVTLPPLSLRHFADALGLLGATQIADARAAVTCDKLFFVFATLFDAPASHVSFLLPAASGSSTLGGGGGTTPPPPGGNALVFESAGLVHRPVRGNEARAVSVPVPSALSLSRLVVEWEVVMGPWNPVNPAGAHLMGWVHRGKFRSNSMFNVNAFGTGRGEVKNVQNVDLPAGGVTNDTRPLLLTQGTRYRFRGVYDAASGTATVNVSSGGQTLAVLSHAATASGGVLTIPASGLVVHFGHTFAQQAGGLELPTYGTEYQNLRVEMYPR